MVEGPKLPFNLATEAGARLIGYLGDSNSRNSAFSNKSRALHEDYQNCVREVIGDVTITTTKSERGGFSPGDYLRTNVGNLLTRITSVAGLNNNIDQKLADNPIPLWLHVCRVEVIAACISALWDAEGSVNFHDLKVSQATLLRGELGEKIPNWPSNLAYGVLSRASQAVVLREPPLLLVSASLLLRKLGIRSRLRPSKVSMTSTGATTYWQLRVNDIQSISQFQSQVSLVSQNKSDRLAFCATGIPKRRPVDPM